MANFCQRISHLNGYTLETKIQDNLEIIVEILLVPIKNFI